MWPLRLAAAKLRVGLIIPLYDRSQPTYAAKHTAHIINYILYTFQWLLRAPGGMHRFPVRMFPPCPVHNRPAGREKRGKNPPHGRIPVLRSAQDEIVQTRYQGKKYVSRQNGAGARSPDTIRPLQIRKQV